MIDTKTQEGPVSVMVVGAGSRGAGYARYAHEHPDRLRVVAVADPRDSRRQEMALQYTIPQDRSFVDWHDALAVGEKLADFVLIATQDADHIEPAIAFADAGYSILLEKPMATSEEDCRAIVDAVKRNGVMFGVCHVLRYTHYTRKLMEVIESGAIGKLVTMDRYEPVGYWHQAHSFVRGNWRREDESTFMLMAKSCHDMDWLRHVVGKPCKKISSFGSLKHFKESEAPEGAGQRCIDCSVEAQCPYSAKRFYENCLADPELRGWVKIITDDVTEEGLEKALREGPYGRCVYHCDNDVVDHQVVSLLFEDNVTATFTMTAFSEHGHRWDRINGTHGMIVGDGETLTVTDFLTDQKTIVETNVGGDASMLGGHGGGDYMLIDAYVKAIATNDPTLILSGANESLESHLMAYAAERSRLNGTTESV